MKNIITRLEADIAKARAHLDTLNCNATTLSDREVEERIIQRAKLDAFEEVRASIQEFLYQKELGA